MGDDDLSKWRDEFPILSRTVYMISNSLGAMPRQTARNLAEYADTWATRGVRAWEDRWWEMPAEIGDKIAGVVGAPVRFAQAARLFGDGLSVDDLSVSRAAGGRVRAAGRAGRGRSHRAHRAHARCDRRSDGGRGFLTRAVPHLLH